MLTICTLHTNDYAKSTNLVSLVMQPVVISAKSELN